MAAVIRKRRDGFSLPTSAKLLASANAWEFGMNLTLQSSVLVLNRFWQPVHTCSVRRAMKLVCVGHAQVVQTDGSERFYAHDFPSWLAYSSGYTGEDVIHSVRLAVRAPRVIVLALYDKVPRTEVKFTRRNVFTRDGHTCQYCSKALPEKMLNLDHVIPRDKGGKTTWENIVTSCIRCNTRKANKLPHEAQMFPQRAPRTPRWQPLFGDRDAGNIDASWNHFVDPSPDGVKMSA
jgi:5-methylcytosine-specific restriction endonuclease McrA